MVPRAGVVGVVPPDRLLIVTAAGEALEAAVAWGQALLTKLMGKGEAQARRDLMELHGDSVEVDV